MDYPMKPMRFRVYPNRWIVVTPDGRIGRIDSHLNRNRYRVQLGADGPFQIYYGMTLRSATQDEIGALEGTS